MEFVVLAKWDDDDDVVGIIVSGTKWGVRRDMDGSMGLGGQWYVPGGMNEEIVVGTGALLKEKLHWLKMKMARKRTKKTRTFVLNIDLCKVTKFQNYISKS